MANMTTSLYIMRHGATADNSPNPTKDRVKGQLDLPLDRDGIQAAHEAGKALQNSGVTAIVTSQMKRSIQTGQIVKGYLPDAKVVSTKMLNPWDVGAYTGQSYAHVKNDLSRLQKNPMEAPPAGKQMKGEPYGDFLDRYKQAMPRILGVAEKQPTLFVAHSRHLVALDGMMKGTEGDTTQVRDVTPPGTVLKLNVWAGDEKAPEAEAKAPAGDGDGEQPGY